MNKDCFGDYSTALLDAKAAIKQLDECLPNMGYMALGANNGARDLLQAAAYLYAMTDKVAKEEIAEFFHKQTKSA